MYRQKRQKVHRRAAELYFEAVPQIRKYRHFGLDGHAAATIDRRSGAPAV
jgi:hypothetical protein